MTSSQQQTIPGQQRRDHPRIAPTLPHILTQLEPPPPPATPQNTGRPRKSAKEKLLEKARAAERRRDLEEPRFNVAAPVQPRYGRRPNARVPRPPHTQGPLAASLARNTIVPDEPPPSFQEAIMESSPPPFNAIDARVAEARPHAEASITAEPIPASAAPTSLREVDPPAVVTPVLEPSHLPPLGAADSHGQTPTLNTISTDTPAFAEGSDGASEVSSAELVDGSPSQYWETDRQAGLSLDERVKRELRRQQSRPLDALNTPPQQPHHALHDVSLHTPASAHHHCDRCGCLGALDLDPEPAQSSPQKSDSDTSSSPPISPRIGLFSWKKRLMPIGVQDARSGTNSSSPVLVSPLSPFRSKHAPWASNGSPLVTTAHANGASSSNDAASGPPPRQKRKESHVRRFFTMSKGKDKDKESISKHETALQEEEDPDVWQVVTRKPEEAYSKNRKSMHLDVSPQRIGEELPLRSGPKHPLNARERLTVDTVSANSHAMPAPFVPASGACLSAQPLFKAIDNTDRNVDYPQCGSHARTLDTPVGTPPLHRAPTSAPGQMGMPSSTPIAAGRQDVPSSSSRIIIDATSTFSMRPRISANSRSEEYDPLSSSTFVHANEILHARALLAAGRAISPSVPVLLTSVSSENLLRGDLKQRPRVTSSSSDSLAQVKSRPTNLPFIPTYNNPGIPSTPHSVEMPREIILFDDPPTPRTYVRLPRTYSPGYHAMPIGEATALHASVAPRIPRLMNLPIPSVESSPAVSAMSVLKPGSVPDLILNDDDYEVPLEGNSHYNLARIPDTTCVGTPPVRTVTPVPESPPQTPSSPSHHYHGRPLPQPPAQPSPSITPKSLFPYGASDLGDYPHYADLNTVTARTVEGYQEGRDYADILACPEVVNPAIFDSPFDIPGQRLSAVAPVQLQRPRLKDSRVKIKLILMGREVDKCCICMSYFKQEELATLGTDCDHAFHEYCLRRWLQRSTTCPLCRKPV